MTVSRRPRGAMGAAWLVIALLAVLLATLPPQHGTRSGTFFRSLLPHNLRWGDVAQNIALYVPLGLLLGARGASLRTTLGAAAGLSLATELLQFGIPGRDPAARDVVVNTLGAWLGYLAARSKRSGPAVVKAIDASERWLIHAANPDARRASLLLLGWVSAMMVVFVVTAALLAPAPLPFGGLSIASPFIDRSQSPLRIGSSGARGGFFKGTIDEVRIFDRVRTPAQIAEDMRRERIPVADTGLVAQYSFDSDRGAVVRDDTGHGHNGAASGTAWTSQGRFGGALMFDGVASEVIVPHAAALNVAETLTLEAWIRAANVLSHEATVIGRADDAYLLRATSNQGPFRPAAGGRFGSMSRLAYRAEPFAPGEWTHLAMTYDGQSIRLYVDGVLSTTSVHWSPHRPERASLNGGELEPGLVGDAEAFRAALLRPLTLHVSLMCGPPSDTPAPVFLISGLQSSEALALIAAGRDLFIKPMALSSRFRLASPATRVSGALAGCEPGHRVDLTVTGHLQNPRVVRGDEVLAGDSPSLGAAWTFVAPADLLPAWTGWIVTMTWLAFLGVPLGLWARRTALGAAGLILIGLALVYVPDAFHVRHLDPAETGALAVGALAGMVSRAAVGRVRLHPNGFACGGTL